MADETDRPLPQNGPKTTEELIVEFANQIFQAMDREGRPVLRRAVQCGTRRLTVAIRREKRTASEELRDLPEKVARESVAIRRIYRVVRAIRLRDGDKRRLGPREVFEQFTNGEVAIRTVHRALKRLRVIGVLYCHPESGYRLGSEQPELPFTGWQFGSPSQPRKKE